MSARKKNMAASIKQRLLDRSRIRKEDVQLLLIRYGLERFLYRLGCSDYRQRFILKGAMLFPYWEIDEHRPTRDIDLLGFGESAAAELAEVVREVLSLEIEDDGLQFDLNSISAEEIREDLEYGGVRIKFNAYLEQARIGLQIDIGFGDIVSPEPQEIIYPSLFDLPAPRIRAYPRETVLAEKFHAMVILGMANSRMKDFYDVWILARLFEFDGQLLARAIEQSFVRRKTEVPTSPPLAFCEEFYGDSSKQAQWRAFWNRNKLTGDFVSLEKTVALISGFLMPLCTAVTSGQQIVTQWPPGGDWEPFRETD